MRIVRELWPDRRETWPRAKRMRIETTEDFERARERLRRRDSESLAAFILSLAQDSGPIGQQVRTFIVGDDDSGRGAGVPIFCEGAA
jgi:hypothetical protein